MISSLGLTPTFDERAQQDGGLPVQADRGGYLSWDVDHAEWVVTLHHLGE